MSGRSCPIPGERSTAWLENARQNFTEFVNPMPDVPLIPGRSERARELEKRMGTQTGSFARKWER